MQLQGWQTHLLAATNFCTAPKLRMSYFSKQLKKVKRRIMFPDVKIM